MTNVQKLIQALAGPAQDLENALQQLLLDRTVSTATGVQLDLLGRVVGQARLGLDDTDYRRTLQARIATNGSRGNAESLIRVAVLLVQDATGDAVVTVTNEGAATCIVELDGIATTGALAALIFSFLVEAVSAGVRLQLRWGESPPAEWFRLDIGPGLDQGHLAGGLG
jgi:Protein of unknown function (DUF2612)